jgi:hypothetical protein
MELFMSLENPADEGFSLSKDDDAIAADWEKIQEKYAAEDAPVEVTKASEELTAPAEEKPGRTANRQRDERGRLLPKSVEPESKESAPVEATPTAQPVTPPKEETAPAADTAADPHLAIPPSSWKPAAKAAWNTLPPEIRAEIQRREGDMLKGQGQLLPDATFGKSMRQAVDPYRGIIEAAGSTPEAAVSSLLRTAAILRTGSPQDKQNALLSIARDYQVALPTSDGSIGQAPFNPADFRDPRVDQMLAQQQEAQTATIEQAISNFQNALDDQGKPLHPYMANVEAEMMAFIPQIKSSMPDLNHAGILKEAYDRAVWANPETRALLEKQRFDELEAKRREDNLRQVAEAKKAASVNVPKRGFTNKTQAKQSIDRTIEDAARELGLIN